MAIRLISRLAPQRDAFSASQSPMRRVARGVPRAPDQGAQKTDARPVLALPAASAMRRLRPTVCLRALGDVGDVEAARHAVLLKRLDALESALCPPALGAFGDVDAERHAALLRRLDALEVEQGKTQRALQKLGRALSFFAGVRAGQRRREEDPSTEDLSKPWQSSLYTKLDDLAAQAQSHGKVLEALDLTLDYLYQQRNSP